MEKDQKILLLIAGIQFLMFFYHLLDGMVLIAIPFLNSDEMQFTYIIPLIGTYLTYIIIPLVGIYWSFKNINENKKVFGFLFMLFFLGIIIFATTLTVMNYFNPFIRLS